MGGSPAIDPYQQYINYLKDVDLQPEARTHVGIGFSRSNIYQ
jgi:hypothetical protein